MKKSNALQIEVDQLSKVIEALQSQLVKPIKPVLEKEIVFSAKELPPEPDMTAVKVLIAARKECELRILKKHEELKDERVSDKWRADLASKNAQLANLKRYRDRFDALKREIEAMSDGTCPTCSGPWTDTKRLDAKQQQMEMLEPEIAKIQPLASEIQDLEARIASSAKTEAGESDAFRQLEQLRKVQEDLLAAIDEEDHAIREARRAREDVERENQTLQMKAEWIRSTNHRLEQEYNKAYHVHWKMECEIDAKNRDLYAKMKLVAEEADYAAALKAYLGGLFDEVLAQISTETNELLRSVPNTPTTTVTFVSENVTQKGTTRQEIKPVIIKNGKQADLRSGISGGQLESVELAVDLSITKVIGQRTGVRPGFMIFDESFSAHCMPTKEACLQVLKQAAQDCLILVVDHATELRDYFDAFIDVESDRDVSRFSIQG